MPRHRYLVGFLGAVGALIVAVPNFASEPNEVAQHVDQLLAKEIGSTEASARLADDEVYLRRITLDVVGRSPTPEEAIVFSLDRDVNKRGREVDRLLADSRFGENWARYWRDVILYRRTEDRAVLSSEACYRFLADCFNNNKPWDQIAHSFITATGNVAENGEAALIMAQGGRPEDTVAEISRIFMGIQIQCAQCHDHPTDRWKREQFHELAAFFPRVAVRPDRMTTPPTFLIVVNDRPGNFAPRNANQRFNGTPEHYMPDKDDPSARGTVMKPVFFVTGDKLKIGTKDADRRQQLATWITSREDLWFSTAFVNRMWAELVGEGFYEPVDDIGPDRQCSAPETSAYLAKEFCDSGYDVKWLIRSIMATTTYQRESHSRRTPDNPAFQASVPQRLRGDQLYSQLASILNLADTDPPRNGPARPQQLLRTPRGSFNAVFGYDPSSPRDEIAGSIPQALLMMNFGPLNQAISGRGGPLGRLLNDVADNDELAVELYLRTLSRQPTVKELNTCREYVAQVGDRREAFEDILWSLVNSTEFQHRR